MGITLTDEQWQEVKAELMSDMKAVFRDVVYEIIETEVDFENTIIQIIAEKISKNVN